MVREIIIQPNSDNQIQRAFKENFEEWSGAELYENIIVREENGLQYVYSKLNGVCHQSLLSSLAKFGIEVKSVTDFTGNMLDFYTNNRLGEFMDSMEALSPEDFVLDFYSKHIGIDQVLDKISTSGMQSLNFQDRGILNIPEVKKSAIC
jgi:hypothetical protein